MCSVQDEENVPTDLSQSKGRVHHNPHGRYKHGKGRKRLLPKCQETWQTRKFPVNCGIRKYFAKPNRATVTVIILLSNTCYFNTEWEYEYAVCNTKYT
jgi:hypothetical protein